jgi:hypothetical protein
MACVCTVTPLYDLSHVSCIVHTNISNELMHARLDEQSARMTRPASCTVMTCNVFIIHDTHDVIARTMVVSKLVQLCSANNQCDVWCCNFYHVIHENTQLVLA